MTIRTWLTLLVITVAVMAASVSPFLPGLFNNFLYGVSKFLQGSGFFSLVFMPFGLIWLITEIKNKKDQKFNRWTNGYYTALLAASPLMILFVFQIAGGISNKIWLHSEFWSIFAPVMFILTGILAFSLFQIKKLKQKQAYKFNTTPFFLTLVPVIVFLNSQFVVEKAAAFTRGKAIVKTIPLIEAIEKYKADKGVYPDKLEELTGKYIAVIPQFNSKGTKEYKYSRYDETYQLSFERLWQWNATEVVVYNLLEEERRKFSYEDFETSFANWRYYMAD